VAAAISVSGLTKRFGDVLAVDDISFEVDTGSVFAFLGANGAGKSTTIGCVTTVSPFDAGEIRVAGHDVRRDSEPVRGQIGVVFQDSMLDAQLTARENLTTRARFYTADRAQIRDRVTELSALIGLDDFLDRRYGKLSAASGDVSISREHCCTHPRSSSSMNPRRASTRPAGRSSGRPSTTCATGTG
jgi:multidrug/hemolysin transport system ATP-binding protein